MRLRLSFSAALCAAIFLTSHIQAEETPMNAEIALFLTVKTQPGKRDDLVALWEAHLRDRAAANDDQVRYVFALDLNDPDTIRITEVYATQAAFEANSQAPWFADYMAAAGPLLAGEPDFHMARPHWIK